MIAIVVETQVQVQRRRKQAGGIVSGGRDKQSSRDRPFNFNHFTPQRLYAPPIAISTANELNHVPSAVTIQFYVRRPSKS